MIDLLVDADEAGSALTDAILSARHTIDLQMLTFEGDRVGLHFADLLIRRAREGLRVRVLIDHFTLMMLSDVFIIPGYLFSGALRREFRSTRRMLANLRENGAEVRLTNHPGSNPWTVLRRNHKKMIVVDGKLAFLGGINLSEHNFAWHDLMIRLGGVLAQCLLQDFNRTWSGRVSIPVLSTMTNTRFLGNTRILRDTVSALVEGAEREILLESPYAGGWIIQQLARAASRGVRVSVIVPARNNFPFFAYLHRIYRLRYSRTGLVFYRYPGHGGMTHLKAMVADNTAVIGSSNFSMHFLEESALVTRDTRFVEELRRRVFDADIRCSENQGG